MMMPIPMTTPLIMMKIDDSDIYDDRNGEDYGNDVVG